MPGHFPCVQRRCGGGDCGSAASVITATNRARHALLLPLELWNLVMLFIGHERLLQHHRAWSLSCRAMRGISNSPSMWLGRLVALHAAVVASAEEQQRTLGVQPSGQGAPSPPPRRIVPITLYMSLVAAQPSLPDQHARRPWDWKTCFLHFFFSQVSQRCLVCCLPPGAANQPTCTFSWRDRDRSRDLHVDAPPDEHDPPPLSQEMLHRFPFEGCSLCSICLRRYCWLKSMPQGKLDAKNGRRFYRVNRGRWVVCVRSDVDEVVMMRRRAVNGDDDTADDKACSGGAVKRNRHGTSDSPRPSRSGGYNISRSPPGDSEAGEQLHALHREVDQELAASHSAVRMFVARAQQRDAERYISPSYRAHEAPKDPLNFLMWSGHSM